MRVEDRNRLALSELAAARRLALRTAARCPRWIDRDELVGEAALALVLAARRYDPARGVPFGAYAARTVKFALLNSLREQGTGRRRDRPLPVAYDDREHAPAVRSHEAETVAAATLDRVASRLSERDRAALGWRYAEERTLREIGARLGGLTEPGALLAVQRALGRARRVVESC